MAKKSDFTEQEWEQLRKGATQVRLPAAVLVQRRSFPSAPRRSWAPLAKYLACGSFGRERARRCDLAG